MRGEGSRDIQEGRKMRQNGLPTAMEGRAGRKMTIIWKTASWRNTEVLDAAPGHPCRG